MMAALAQLFAAHQAGGTVRYDYHANLYCARIDEKSPV
jgi:hypothetical protein